MVGVGVGRVHYFSLSDRSSPCHRSPLRIDPARGEGTSFVSMNVSPTSRRLRIALVSACALLLALVASAAVLDRLFPPDLSRLHDLSVLVTDKDGKLLRAFPAADGN